jgi:hypothetical protein
MSNIHTALPSLLDGDEFKSSDAQGMGDGMRTLLGNALSGILGAQTAIPMLNPFTVLASGGMTIAVGGSGGQALYLDSVNGPRYVDNAPAQTFTIAASDATFARNDLLCASYSTPQPITSSGTRKNEATDGTIATVAANTQSESVTYQLVQGTPATTHVDPAVPTGFIAIARIVVGASVSSIIQGNITIIPQTMQALILSTITATGYVDRTTNQSVAGNKVFTGITTVGGIQFNQTDTAFSGVAGIRLNSAGSILINPSGTGHTVNLGYDDSGLTNIYFGPGNLWGNITASGYFTPTGYTISNAGTATTQGFTFGNATAVGAQTSIGSSGAALQTIPATIMNIANVGVGQLVTLDGAGNMGLAGGLYAPHLSIVGDGGVSGTFQWGGGSLHANGDLSATGTLFATAVSISGVLLPTTFTSSDSSVIPANGSGTLNITLPSGFINSFTSSAGTIGYSQTGRSLNVDVTSGLTYKNVSRPAPGSYPYTSSALTLSALPGPSSKQYLITAYMSCDLNASGVQTLALGGCATSETTQSQQDGGGGSQPIEIRGTAVGGSTPSVVWTNSNGLGSTNWIGLLTIEAIAI